VFRKGLHGPELIGIHTGYLGESNENCATAISKTMYKWIISEADK
jgi:hypothetical protein